MGLNWRIFLLSSTLCLLVGTPSLATESDPETPPDDPEPPSQSPPQPSATDAAAEPDASAAQVTAEPDEGPATITVYGEHLVDQARSKVERELEEQGYEQRIRKDDYTVFRHGSAWKGEVRVYDDGWIRMKRQPVQFKPPKNSPVGWATCVVVPLCVRSGGQTVSRRKHMAQRRRSLAQLEPLARQYGDRVADLHVDRRLEDLPDRLSALWTDGVPLEEGGTPLPTVKQRKAALLAYWESRTETVWGRRVRAAVEAFIREEVQYSPFPYAPEEIDTFNLDRHTETELDLDRPWDLVLADLEERAGE